MLFPHFNDLLYANWQLIVTFTQQIKTIDSNNMSSMFPFHNVWPIKRKAVYTGLGCSKAGYRYPPDKSLFNG